MKWAKKCKADLIVVLLLATRCLYWGVHLTIQLSTAFSIALFRMSSWPDVVVLWPPDASSGGCLTVHCILNCIPQHVIMTLCSTGPHHTRCLYWGVCLQFLNSFQFHAFASQRSFLWKTNENSPQKIKTHVIS